MDINLFEVFESLCIDKILLLSDDDSPEKL